MINQEQLCLKAHQNWLLDSLCLNLEDQKNIKGEKKRKLTEREKTYLCAALLQIPQENLAKQLFIELKSLRVSLSKGLNFYLKNLLDMDCKKRLCWHEIPELLEKAGYKRLSPNEAWQFWESISEPSEESYAQPIIDAVEDKLLKIEISGDKPRIPEDIAISSQKLGDEAEEQKDYSKAIACYRVPLEQDPILYNSFLVKIAACLNQMELYADLVLLALFALKRVSDNDGKSILYGLLGSAFYELALKTLNELFLKESLKYYDHSKQRSWGFNIVGIWDSFDLLVKFCQQKTEKTEKYLRKAKLTFVDFEKLAFVDFKKLIINPKSNFGEYKEAIIADAKEISKNLQDQWLIEQLNHLISINN